MSLPKSPLQLLTSHRGPDVSLKLVKKAGRLSTLSQRIPEEPQPEMLKQPVPFYRLFRYSSAKDILYIGIAILSASVAGAAFPVCNFLVAEISSLMIEIEGGWFCNNRNNTPAFNTNVSADHAFIRDFENTLNDVCIYLAASAAIQFFCAYIAIWMFNIVAENEIFKLKRHYLRALLRQDVAWHDTASDTVSLTHLTEDMGKVSDAIGTKLALFIYYAINSFLCVIIAVYVGWLLTLVTLCITPVALCASAAVEVFTSHLSVKHQSQFSKCGLIIQQTVINIKTVMAFTGQNKQIQQYEAALKPANQTELKQQLFNAFGLGFSWLLKYCSYALSVWYATKLFYDDVDNICGKDPRIYDAKAVIVILFSILDFESNLSECAAFLDAFSEGSGAATAIYEVIDRMPAIDSLSKEGIKHETPLAGKIEFRGVHFTYPSRAHTKILKGFNLTVEAGTTVALVGASGCGKSTCLQLIQRFYDPDEGEILVDGIDIRKYNVRWYRSQIAVVNQEPTLFDTTIEENIRFGNPDISEADLEEAIRKAQAHRFIARLPHRLKTRVGERGAQLSGGQKQRIAICRAIIKNPSILLLDEITSALDVAAEAAVQKAIDRIKRGRTTIIVAHRIATLRNADVIGIVHDGRIVALGPPEELGKQANMFLGRLLAETVTDVDEDSLGGVTSDQSVVTVVDDSDDFTAHGDDDLASVSSEELSRELRSLMRFSTILKLVCLSKKQWPLVILGVIMCLAHGFILPATSYIFGQVLHVFAKDNRRTAEDLVAKYAIIFLGLGGISFFTQFLSLSFFGCAGESLQSRLRKMTFAAMMRQGLPWFQRPDNNVGSICARFSRDIVSIHEATGPHLGLFLGAVWTVIALLGLSLYLDWRLALVGWAFAVLIFLGAFFNGRLVETEDNEGFHEEKASTIVFQAISNIRTVCMLDLQDTFIQQVTIELNRTHKSNKRRAHVLGFVFGASQAVSNFAYACIMYYGGILVLNHQTDHGNVFTIGEGLISTSLEVGLTLAYVINYSKTKIAAARIYDIIQRTVGTEDEFHGKDIKACKGDIKFEDVSFSFTPNRNFAALRNISWEIGPDQHLAICGSSGSGKSTMLEMILRFHDPTHGRICLDDVDLKDIRPESLRSQMSIVSQDAALFDSSVAENIAYGMHTKKLDMRAVIFAAKQANIHDFIKSLPSGYATKVGTLGAQLSGGQKQRVAIARALATKPKILLLDEATSALDPESEGLVEQAIENSRVGRTCISIAHKLGSIQHADKILVVSSGNLVEQGTHEELMAMKGVYHHMYHLQYGHHTD